MLMNSSLSLLPAPTTLSRNWKHHVFPSFHGPDVRKTFLSHILVVFRGKGIDPFIDNNIPRSKSIGPELIEAIRGSKIAIVLLSKNYASSSWCLNELAEIMKCREKLGQIVMTIFYEVDPTDVKKQMGDFGKAFRKTCKGKTKEHIERWRKALEDVATIAGWHSHNWSNEADMIEKIATDVSNMLNISTPSRDFDDFVGMGPHMEKMEQLLRLDLKDEVRMIGIWGPPGIGKTTIARVLFNQVSGRFQLGAFMVNIKGCYPRPCLDEYSAQLQLQYQMLSQMTNHKDIQMIHHLGVAQERLKDKKVFLVLDDVDRLGQLHALAKEIQWFGLGSRIIITTEDLGVLKAHGINHVYEVDFPSSNEAFQIFCMHAFGKKYPDDGFGKLAWEVMALAGQLPLGLEVLGSALRGKSKHEWKMILPRLKTRLDGKVENIIKFSYDALCDEDKDLFLYIACHFNNRSAHEVEKILANKFPHMMQGLHVLAEKSLISLDVGYDGNDWIEMHTLVEQFGREASRKQFNNGIAKCQFLVGDGDLRELLLSDDTIDSKQIIGIKIDFDDFDEFDDCDVFDESDISDKALFLNSLSDLQFVWLNGSIDFSKRLHSLLCHSQKIRSLCWEGFQNKCLPSTFNPEFLVQLYMPHSKLRKLWKGTKQLQNLRWMDLSHSEDLKELPDLSTATNLETLNLENCTSLRELSPSSTGIATNLKKMKDIIRFSNLVKLPSSSTGYLTNLKRLNLEDCSSLLKLPSFIGTATNLQQLDISECSSLQKLPDSIGKLTNLQKLDMSGCSSLVELPSSIGTATNLKEFDISGCVRLVKLPSSNGYLTNLEKLNLSNCSSLLELPPIGSATNIQELDISECIRLDKLPDSIGNLTNLQKLDITGCSSLVELPSSIGFLVNLKILKLYNCSSLVELPSSIGNLQRLRWLEMPRCSKLEALPTNINLESLETLDLTDCSQLKCFPEISTNIKDLRLKRTAIKEVPLSIMSWSGLSNFQISYFKSLKEFPHAHDVITELDFVNEDIKEVPPWVKGLSRLRSIRLYNCNNLVSLPQLSDSLCEIVAENCQSLERLDCSFNNPEIHLNFPKCFNLNQEARDLISS